jgi:hypothetical protein
MGDIVHDAPGDLDPDRLRGDDLPVRVNPHLFRFRFRLFDILAVGPRGERTPTARA